MDLVQNIKPVMLIKFQKNIEKQSTLTCVRPDGTTTWTRIYPGLEIHDLAHYVVETEMGFREAFYGMVAGGTDIGDYALPRDQRPEEVKPTNLSKQALQTEHLVNLLQIRFSGDSQLDILSILRRILEENDIEFPGNLHEDMLRRIDHRLSELLKRWENVEDGGTLEMTFQ